jgi:hypothetical protein
MEVNVYLHVLSALPTGTRCHLDKRVYVDVCNSLYSYGKRIYILCVCSNNSYGIARLKIILRFDFSASKRQVGYKDYLLLLGLCAVSSDKNLPTDVSKKKYYFTLKMVAVRAS